MKNMIIFLSVVVLGFSALQGQNYAPVKWNTNVKKLSKDEYLLIAKAKLESGWHLYSQDVPNNGPSPTSFDFKQNENYELVGNLEESEGKTHFDPVFDMVITYFEKEAKFTQKIKVKKEPENKISAKVKFMVCDNEHCLPPTDENLTFTPSPDEL